MNITKAAVAALQGLLILPAVLFMGSLVVRNLPLPQYELARNAQRIVMWYSARQWTLWILLIVLPLSVLVTGCLMLLSPGNNDVERPPVATLFVAAATVMSGGVLAIVIVHMLAN